jgi:membrane peptidoglycan carboxypeptidase
VIPSPRRFAARLPRSGITPWWNARIDDVLGKMRIQNQLSEEQYSAALGESLRPRASDHVPIPDEGGAAEAGEPVQDEEKPASDRPGDASSPTRHR